jgi:hypothetical protein
MLFRLKPISLINKISRTSIKLNFAQIRNSSTEGLSQKITQTLYSEPVLKKLNLLENNYQDLVDKLNNVIYY